VAAFEVDINIPVYNEGRNIQRTLDSLAENTTKIGAHVSVNIIYDFDGDDTLPIIENIRHRYPFRIETVRNPERGVANAIKTGPKASKS
jgi:glycosyltransferase involved in cell wall biosynthesis